MTPSTIALVALRSAALALSASGQRRASDQLYNISDAYEAGRATDEHMALVAAKLKTRQVVGLDWDDVEKRIADDAARLHSKS